MITRSVLVVYVILHCSIYRSDGDACLATNQELVFVVGTTSGPSSWRSYINFTSQVIDGFEHIGQKATRVSFVRYAGRRPQVAFYLNLYNDKNSVMNAVAAVEYLAENATETGDLAAAIDVVRTQALYTATVRPDAWKTAVIVVDQLPSAADSLRLRRAVVDAELSGIELVAVGIGVDNLDLLHRIGRCEHNGTSLQRTTYVAERGQLGGIVAATTALACFEGLPRAAKNPAETDKQNEYDTYLDMGVYPDASVNINDEHAVNEEKRTHTGVMAVVVVIGALVLLMMTFAAIVYCRRIVKERSQVKAATAIKPTELTGHLLRRPSLYKSQQLDNRTGTLNSNALQSSGKLQPGPNGSKSLGVRPWTVADVTMACD